jgi:two-component system cell cycle response regulator
MKVLLTDNDAISRLLVCRTISSLGFEVVTAAGADDAWSVLQEDDAPQLALIDWNIGGLATRTLCERASLLAKGHCRYFVSLVPRNKEAALWAMQSGCDDYVCKPIDTAELKARLRIGARVIDLTNRLINAQKGQQKNAEPQASHDPLTGVWNRAAMIEFLRGQFARSGRDGVSLAVAVAAVDDFATFKERNGLHSTDNFLKQIAARMRSAIRPYDWLGRFSEDSFLIIAPDCTLSNGFAVCERLRSLVSDALFDSKEKAAPLTMSFGVATSAESGATHADELLRAAEAALAIARQNGSNRVEAAKRTPRLRGAQGRPAQVQHRELLQ